MSRFKQGPELITWVSVTKAPSTGSSTISIYPIGDTLLFADDEIIINTGSTTYHLIVASDVSATATSMSVRGTILGEIPIQSFVQINNKQMATKATTKDLYAHQSLYLTTGTNGNDYLSAFGTSSFSVNSAVVLADGASKPNRWTSQYTIFVAPRACTFTNIKGTASSNAGAGDDAEISVWKATPNYGGTSNVTISLVNEFTCTSQNNQNHVFDLLDNTPSNSSLAAGDVIFVSIRRTGAKAGSIKWYADIGMQFKMKN